MSSTQGLVFSFSEVLLSFFPSIFQQGGARCFDVSLLFSAIFPLKC